jgi:hypothetical protein
MNNVQSCHGYKAYRFRLFANVGQDKIQDISLALLLIFLSIRKLFFGSYNYRHNELLFPKYFFILTPMYLYS